MGISTRETAAVKVRLPVPTRYLSISVIIYCLIRRQPVNSILILLEVDNILNRTKLKIFGESDEGQRDPEKDKGARRSDLVPVVNLRKLSIYGERSEKQKKAQSLPPPPPPPPSLRPRSRVSFHARAAVNRELARRLAG